MRIPLLIAMVVLTTGCSSWSTSSVKPANGQSNVVKTVNQKSKSQVVLTESDITQRKYKVLADVSATVNKTTVFNRDPTQEQVNEKLKEKAAKLGADAVVLVRYGDTGISFFSWGSLNGKGRAITFID